MSKLKNYKANSDNENNLAEAFARLKNRQDVLNLLRDVATINELEEMGRRFEIARLLEKTDMSYDAIAKKMKTSTTTVTRVAHWLNNGCGGYKKAI